jgi:phage-related protein
VTETLTFFNPGDEEVELTGSDYSTVLWGVNGRFMPPVDFVEDETPEREGARVRRVKIRPREITVPVLLEGSSQTDLRQQLRTIVRRLYPVAGDGRLRCVAPDGATRELVCRYSQGLEGDEGTGDGGVKYLAAVLVFRAAEDPFWRAQTATEIDFTTGEPPAFFPFFPLELAESSIFGGITVTNEGDVEAWPIWTITGPGGPLTLTNDTSGESLVLATVLSAGEQITIDTTPGIKTVTLDDSTNLYPDLDPGSSLWPLQPDDNAVTVELVDATVDSAVALSYRARYLTP